MARKSSMADQMTFTQLDRHADQIRGRWKFNWLEPDPPVWDWPIAERTLRREVATEVTGPIVLFGSRNHVEQVLELKENL